jgi:phosphatidylglycerophosphate synthase
VAVSSIGKFKTTFQLIAIGLMLLNAQVKAFGSYFSLYFFGITLLWLAAILTVWSMVVYLQNAWPVLRGEGASKT